MCSWSFENLVHSTNYEEIQRIPKEYKPIKSRMTREAKEKKYRKAWPIGLGGFNRAHAVTLSATEISKVSLIVTNTLAPMFLPLS